MKTTILLFVAIFMTHGFATDAKGAFLIEDIQVEGLTNIRAETVFDSLPISIAVLHTVNASILLMSMITLLYYSTYCIQK